MGFEDPSRRAFAFDQINSEEESMFIAKSGVLNVVVASISGILAYPAAHAAAVDPGVRGGPAGAGGPLPGLTMMEERYFEAGLEEFEAVSSVEGETFIPGTEVGLGPRFNLDACGACHAHPAVGGTSPFINPQVLGATAFGASNVVPSFITPNGPVREARFKFNRDGSRDGNVHQLFVISGRVDARGCNIKQPDFAAAAAADNLVFRIPTPVFGAGLIEMIPDSAILANRTANLTAKQALGISGRENREGNAGTITRFGWKAQNKSLLLFSGEAYNVEMGVSNQLFQDEIDQTPSCLPNALPESDIALNGNVVEIPGAIELFAVFQRFLAPPTPAPDTPSIANGRALFQSAGCALCHTPTLSTGPNPVAALSNKPANLFSDLLVHNMGPGLADDIVQGNAGPDEFRTAPLWGLGQRIFFLHDGRTADLMTAIQAHKSAGNEKFQASEANRVIDNFNALTDAQQQDVLNFLRSL
jgi:CxxC motif-containing protein (DUF1111 family)